MSKTAVFFGSSTGNTEDVANQIAEKLQAEVFNVGDNPTDQLAQYDNLIFGTSTWGEGDLQDDWESFIDEVKNADFNGKTVAIFGCGDGGSNPDTFVGGMFHIYDAIKDKGCKIIGNTSTEGYEFDHSEAIINEEFIGLPIDEMNQSELTEERISQWVEKIKEDFI